MVWADTLYVSTPDRFVVLTPIGSIKGISYADPGGRQATGSTRLEGGAKWLLPSERCAEATLLFRSGL
jgi:hypothetical protein